MSVIPPIELSELAEAIAAVVVDRLANRTRLTDRCETAKALGISQPTLDRLRSSGQITAIKIGARVMYDIDAVITELSGGGNDV